MLRMGHCMNVLWSRDFGHDVFHSTMAKNCFRTITHSIQFDDKTTRSTRRQEDKPCLVTEVWYKFIFNYLTSYMYHPTAMLTVDEQLFTKPGSQEWPFKVFCNILGVTRINSHTVFKVGNNSKQSR